MACTAPNSLSYYGTSASILSTIGAFYVFIGIMVAGIRGKVTALLVVPIIASIGCAVANGLAYYRDYVGCPLVNQAVSFLFSHILWTVQEAGLPFYGYIILLNLLRDWDRIIYMTIYWSLMLMIVAIRITIAVIHTNVLLHDIPQTNTYSVRISRLHIGYFLPLALAETVTSIFLLKVFRSVLKSSTTGGLTGSTLFRYLMRSTEIRVATLAFIGIGRTITFSFSVHEGKYSFLFAQLDKLVYSLLCLFPIVMFIDTVTTQKLHDNDKSDRANMLPDPGVIENGAACPASDVS